MTPRRIASSITTRCSQSSSDDPGPLDPIAREDLRAIFRFIARDSRIYARRVIDLIRKAVERLRRFPMPGKRVPEWADDLVREVNVDRYRVIHRVARSGVEILTVVHTRRDLVAMKPDDSKNP